MRKFLGAGEYGFKFSILAILLSFALIPAAYSSGEAAPAQAAVIPADGSGPTVQATAPTTQTQTDIPSGSIGGSPSSNDVLTPSNQNTAQSQTTPAPIVQQQKQQPQPAQWVTTSQVINIGGQLGNRPTTGLYYNVNATTGAVTVQVYVAGTGGVGNPANLNAPVTGYSINSGGQTIQVSTINGLYTQNGQYYLLINGGTSIPVTVK